VSAVRWLRLLYTYPSGITEQLLDAIAEVPSVARYLDLPLQHIDDQVLRHMRRGHGERFLRRLLGRIRTRLPELTLRTTLLVGHPGETPAAFDRLARFVEEAEFDHLGVFRYSREEGTAAAGIPGRVAASEAQRRARHLMALQRRISRRKLRQRVGEEIEVLVDGTAEESPLLLCGRHAGQAPEIDGCVYLTDGTARPGSLVRARVVRTSDYDLVASIF
jgi:ribosomal protein S12 methylthiotransferase